MTPPEPDGSTTPNDSTDPDTNPTEELRWSRRTTYVDREHGARYPGPGTYDVPRARVETYLDETGWHRPTASAESESETDTGGDLPVTEQPAGADPPGDHTSDVTPDPDPDSEGEDTVSDSEVTGDMDVSSPPDSSEASTTVVRTDTIDALQWRTIVSAIERGDYESSLDDLEEAEQNRDGNTRQSVIEAIETARAERVDAGADPEEAGDQHDPGPAKDEPGPEADAGTETETETETEPDLDLDE